MDGKRRRHPFVRSTQVVGVTIHGDVELVTRSVVAEALFSVAGIAITLQTICHQQHRVILQCPGNVLECKLLNKMCEPSKSFEKGMPSTPQRSTCRPEGGHSSTRLTPQLFRCRRR